MDLIDAAGNLSETDDGTDVTIHCNHSTNPIKPPPKNKYSRKTLTKIQKNYYNTDRHLNALCCHRDEGHFYMFQVNSMIIAGADFRPTGCIPPDIINL